MASERRNTWREGSVWIRRLNTGTVIMVRRFAVTIWSVADSTVTQTIVIGGTCEDKLIADTTAYHATSWLYMPRTSFLVGSLPYKSSSTGTLQALHILLEQQRNCTGNNIKNILFQWNPTMDRIYSTGSPEHVPSLTPSKDRFKPAASHRRGSSWMSFTTAEPRTTALPQATRAFTSF